MERNIKLGKIYHSIQELRIEIFDMIAEIVRNHGTFEFTSNNSCDVRVSGFRPVVGKLSKVWIEDNGIRLSDGEKNETVFFTVFGDNIEYCELELDVEEAYRILSFLVVVDFAEGSGKNNIVKYRKLGDESGEIHQELVPNYFGMKDGKLWNYNTNNEEGLAGDLVTWIDSSTGNVESAKLQSHSVFQVLKVVDETKESGFRVIVLTSNDARGKKVSIHNTEIISVGPVKYGDIDDFQC